MCFRWFNFTSVSLHNHCQLCCRKWFKNGLNHAQTGGLLNDLTQKMPSGFAEAILLGNFKGTGSSPHSIESSQRSGQCKQGERHPACAGGIGGMGFFRRWMLLSEDTHSFKRTLPSLFFPVVRKFLRHMKILFPRLSFIVRAFELCQQLRAFIRKDRIRHREEDVVFLLNMLTQ